MREAIPNSNAATEKELDAAEAVYTQKLQTAEDWVTEKKETCGCEGAEVSKAFGDEKTREKGKGGQPCQR